MNAQQLRNSILQEAIEGRLVPQDPNDEPASVLLERIREEKKRLVKEGKLKKKDLEETPISEDEKPFEIPESWEWVRLGEIASYITDGEHKTPRRITNYCGYYLLSARNVFNGYINLENVDYVDKEEYENISKHCNPHFGDVLISCSGSVGRTAVVKDNNNYVMVRSAAVISPMYTDSDYLMYTLQSKELQSQIGESSKQTAQANLFQRAIKTLKIPLPPLAEQKRIVSKIEELLPKVEEYGKAQDSLDKLNEELPERLRKSILQEAIEGRLVPQDPNDEPASVLLDKIRKEKAQLVKEGKLKKKDLIETPITDDEKPFDIPESWEWVRFGDVVLTSTGKTPTRGDSKYWNKNTYPWVSISDMRQGKYVNNTKEYISQLAADDFFHGEISKKGTLIMSFKLTVGRTSILGIDAYHNEAIISINTIADKNNNTRDYLSFILPIIANWGDSKDAIKGKTLNSRSIYNLMIPLPPLAEQKRIVAKIEELFAEIDKLK